MANTASNGALATGLRSTYQSLPGRGQRKRDPDDDAPQQELRVLRVPVGTRLCDVERWMIFSTLRKCEGNKTRTAALLGVSLKTLYNRLNAYRAQGLAMDYEVPVHEQPGEKGGFDAAFTAASRGESDKVRGEPTRGV